MLVGQREINQSLHKQLYPDLVGRYVMKYLQLIFQDTKHSKKNKHKYEGIGKECYKTIILKPRDNIKIIRIW
jgi:hypothetical protein